MFKNKEDMNLYLKNRYYAKKKWAFNLLGNKCAKCDSVEHLQIDHINSETKEFDVTENLRSRTEMDLLIELKKCQLLCTKCHKKKTKEKKHNSGETNGQAKLKQSDIPAIFELIASKVSLRKIGKLFGVSHVTILYIKKHKTWNVGGLAERSKASHC